MTPYPVTLPDYFTPTSERARAFTGRKEGLEMYKDYVLMTCGVCVQ